MFTFLTCDPCDLDLKSSESKMKRGHVLSKTNQHIKYESSLINNSHDNDLKQCLHFCTSDHCDL